MNISIELNSKKLILSLSIFLFNSLICFAQKRDNFLEYNQPDSIYKNLKVKQKDTHFTTFMAGEDTNEFFDRDGKIIRILIHGLNASYNGSVSDEPKYESIFSYNKKERTVQGKFIDLNNKYGVRCNSYSNNLNIVYDNYEYDSSNNLIHSFSADSMNKIYTENTYYLSRNISVTEQYDLKSNVREFDTVFYRNDKLKDRIEIYYLDTNQNIISKKEKIFNYEFDENNRLKKVIISTDGKKNYYKYYYNNIGLLRKVTLSGIRNITVQFEYQYWD